MKKSLLLAMLPMVLLLGVAGCDDGYSDAVVYGVRTDPMKAVVGGLEPIQPDRPGQLPMLKIMDLENEQNPFYASNKENSLVDTGKFIDPMMASSADREQIRKALDELFGTPASPKVGKIDDDSRKLLHLKDDTLAKGSKLYRLHCVHCHGVTGDGRGPTARWVNPHPRDYRQGRFKFQSINAANDDKTKTPHRDDLMRVLEHGIEGTAMPSFVLLPTDDREALVSYVIHLSMRGQTEFETFKESFEYKKADKSLRLKQSGSIKVLVDDWYNSYVLKSWVDSQKKENQIPIPPFPFDPNDADLFKESVLRGKEIFTNPPKKYNVGNNACLTCHIDFGRRSKFKEDIWGTFSKPNNLIQGVFRGGRRPIDLYRRIHSGIDPSGMIAFGGLLPLTVNFDIVVIRDAAAETAEMKNLLTSDGLKKALAAKGHTLKVIGPSDAKTEKLEQYLKEPGLPVIVFREGGVGKKVRDAVSYPAKASERDLLKAVAAQTDAIWDLVNFVQVLGVPKMRQTMGIYVD